MMAHNFPPSMEWAALGLSYWEAGCWVLLLFARTRREQQQDRHRYELVTEAYDAHHVLQRDGAPYTPLMLQKARGKLREYSKEDVAEHSNRERRVWVTYRNGVYDVTGAKTAHAPSWPV